MDKTKKRAFTIVELVIVIAVIAILAAVLIALFMNLIKKANKSADMQLIRNLNTALTTDAILNGKHTTMQSALDAAEKNGYILEKINATATQSEIIWDSKNDMFCYLNDDGTIEYLPEANIKYPRNTEDSTTYISDKVNDIDYFVISSEISLKYSTYLYNTELTGDIGTITKGLDVGKVTTITSIKYSTPDKQSVIIRSNGGTLTIDAALSTVYHYGFAEVIDVNNVDNSACYHEGGRVGRLIYNDNVGKIFFESSAVVYCYMNTSSDTSANASDTTKAAGAIVYTYVDSGTNQAKGYVTENKEQVTVTNGLVEVSSCKNHNEDYDVVYVGNDVYLVCKCCGAFSKISTDASGTTTVTNSEGVNEGNNNTFSSENVEVKDAVATIGYSKYYSTLAAAVADAVNGDTITMLKNDLLTGTVNITKKISLDLNGKQVGRVVNTLTTALMLSNGELIINDSVGTGSVLANAQAIGMTNSNDKLIINGGKIQGATYGVRIQKGNTVEIDGATIIGGTGGYGIFNQAAQTLSISNANISGAYAINTKSANAEITISNTTLTGSSYGINNTATASITVSNSTISATASNSYAIQSTGGNSNVTVENSNISGGNRAINSSKANSSVTVKSGTISGGTYGIVNSGTLSITDGTIKADSYYGIFNSGTLTMDGGTIIGGTHESNGRGIYNSGTATINAGTISMNAQTADSQAAIDNRKTLTMNGGNVISNVIGVISTDSFTLAGGTITGGIQAVQTLGTTTINGGEIRCDNGICVNVAGGSLTIDNGKLYGDNGIYGQNNPTIAINGGEIMATGEYREEGETKYIPYGIRSYGTTDNNANLTINGGSISAPNGYALDLYHTDAIITNGTLSGSNAIGSWTEDSTCTISGGTFNATGGQVCYAFEGFFTISGGTFTGGETQQEKITTDKHRYNLNCRDENYVAGTAGFTVTGGTFYQFNPQNNQAEGAGTDFTSGDVTVTYNDSTGYYTVVANN